MKTVKKFSSIATIFIFVAASLISCDKDEDNSTPEQPVVPENIGGTPDPTIIPENLSGLVELNTYDVDFGSFKAKASKSSKVVNKKSIDSTIVITLVNGSSINIDKVASFVGFNGGGVSVSLKGTKLKPGDSLQVPYTYKINTNIPGTYTGKSTLTPYFENDSIGKALEVSLKVVIE